MRTSKRIVPSFSADVIYRELGRYAMNGVTGLYFMMENDEPTDLVYSADEWED